MHRYPFMKCFFMYPRKWNYDNKKKKKEKAQIREIQSFKDYGTEINISNVRWH